MIPVKCVFKWIMTHQRHLPDAWNWVRLNFSATCVFITCLQTHSYIPGCLYSGICSRSLHWSVVSSTEDQLSRIHFAAALLPCVCVYWAVNRFSLIHKWCSERILLDHRLICTGGAESFIRQTASTLLKPVQLRTFRSILWVVSSTHLCFWFCLYLYC